MNRNSRWVLFVCVIFSSIGILSSNEVFGQEDRYLKQLLNDPSFGEINRFIAKELEGHYKPDMLGAKIGMINILAKDANLDAKEFSFLVKKGFSDAGTKGLSPPIALEATAGAIAFRIEFQKKEKRLHFQNTASLKGDSLSVLAVAISPDGSTILCGGLDKVIKVWDATTTKEINSIKEHSSSIKSLAFSSDGSRFLSLCFDKIIVWDSKKMTKLVVLDESKVGLLSAAFSADGELIASGSSCERRPASDTEEMVKIWSAKTGEKVSSFIAHRNGCSAIAFSPNGRFVASGGYDCSISVWDLKTKRSVTTFVDKGSFVVNGHRGEICGLAFSNDGRTIYSCNQVGVINVFDATTGEIKVRIPNPFLPNVIAVRSVSLSPVADLLIGPRWSSIYFWDANSGKVIGELTGHTAEITSIAISANGRRIVSGDRAGAVKEWDFSTVK